MTPEVELVVRTFIAVMIPGFSVVAGLLVWMIRSNARTLRALDRVLLSMHGDGNGNRGILGRLDVIEENQATMNRRLEKLEHTLGEL